MNHTITLSRHDDCAELTCVGDLDLHSVDDLRAAIGDAIRSGATTVVVDVTQTGLVDSTTLGVLLHANNACKDAGLSLVIAGAPRIVARSIELTGLDRVLTLTADVPTAKAWRAENAAR